MTETTVQFVSEPEMLERKAEILALLDVFKTYSESELHWELAEIDYLLGKKD